MKNLSLTLACFSIREGTAKQILRSPRLPQDDIRSWPDLLAFWQFWHSMNTRRKTASRYAARGSILCRCESSRNTIFRVKIPGVVRRRGRGFPEKSRPRPRERGAQLHELWTLRSGFCAAMDRKRTANREQLRQVFKEQMSSQCGVVGL